MTERKPFVLIMTDDKIIQAIKDGHQTSTDLSEIIGVHKVTMRGRLIKMWREGLLIRRKIGQTYFYGVMGDSK